MERCVGMIQAPGSWLMDVHMLWHFMDYAVLRPCLYGLGEAFGMESWAFGLRAVYHETGLDGLGVAECVHSLLMGLMNHL